MNRRPRRTLTGLVIALVTALTAILGLAAAANAAVTCSTSNTGGALGAKLETCRGYHDEFIGSVVTGDTSLTFPSKSGGHAFYGVFDLKDKAADGECASLRLTWTGPYGYDYIAYKVCGAGKTDREVFDLNEKTQITGTGTLTISNCQPGSPTGYCSPVYSKHLVG